MKPRELALAALTFSMPSDLAILHTSIDACMLIDQHRLRSRLRAMDRPEHPDSRGGQGARDALERLAADIERSVARREGRRNALPKPTYPEELPVVARRADIAKAIAGHQVVVLCGETGSGKTTQLPKICLELGRGVAGFIGHTQPRRIAARSVAARIAEELRSPLGRAVGYKVRFGDKTGPDSFIKVMTDGILLAETQGDRFLEQYDTLIIDEAHERSLNIDFLLGYLRQLLPKRPDLKLIITSATIDPERFSRHFANAPILEVSGRTYPVEVRYRPLQSEHPDEEDRDMESAILSAVDELARLDRPGGGGGGDILIFLSGEREIRETAEALRKHHPPQTEIIPLYARLSAAEQMRVFQPHAGRRIVLATNVAETSLTVPGIRYVIDPGFARMSRYSSRTKVQRLPIEAISRASADQRKGRCGRVSAGVCIRLYSEQGYLDRPQFTDPEILRTNLASVILQMKSLRLGAVEDFPFVEPPDARMIRDGYETLEELGAVDLAGDLTRTGAELARLPLDPRIGRMILAANAEGCLAEVLVIAAALSVQDPRERPLDKQEAADAAHARFRDEQPDFLAHVNLWTFWHEQSEKLSGSKLRKSCQQNFLSFVRMREWNEIHQQLRGLVAEMGCHLPSPPKPADYDAIHRALLTGLLGNIGVKADTFEYSGARGSKFNIFPGSALFKKGPKWLMAAELVRTTKLYARTAAKIQPEWVERLAGHLVKRTYSEPHWDAESTQVFAFEKVTLYGLEIVARRRVAFGPVDPKAAREIFIHHALVEGEFNTDARFFTHNRLLAAEIKALEAKARKPDLLADVQARFAFYDARVPPGMYNGALFDGWRKKAERDDPRLLFMAREDLLAGPADEITPERFPDALPAGNTVLPLTYRLDPGGPADGITLTVPLEALNQVDPDRPEWLVPGMVRDKVVLLLKSLPRSVRKSFDITPQLVEACVQSLRFGHGSLTEALGDQLERSLGIRIPPDAWKPKTLPEHLRMNLEVVDERGKPLAKGRDLDDVRKQLGPLAEAGFSRLASTVYNRDGITSWDFGDLPEQVEVDRGKVKLSGYPALIDRRTSVSLQLLDSPDAARDATRLGLRRLFMLQAADELSYQARLLPGVDQMCVFYAPMGSCKELRSDLVELVAERAFLGDDPNVRTPVHFDARLTAGWKRLGPVGMEVATLVGQVLSAHHATALKLGAPAPPAWAAGGPVRDMREHLGILVYRGFVATTPYARLRHVPRYLAAIGLRHQKLSNAGLPRDARNAAQFAPLWLRFLHRLAKHRDEGVADPALETYRWMLEEYRVSLFSQELKTSIPISVKRLDEQWAKVRA